MTDKEIKEQAREYAIDNYEECLYDEVIGWQNDYKAREQSYLDGVKWGMEHAIEWHDLRENPADLPKLENKDFSWSITVVNQLGEACHYNYDKSCWETPYVTEIEGVIAWCELPIYKGVREK